MKSLSNVSLFRRGALVQGPMVIPFQYAPEKLQRTLSPHTVGTGTQQARITAPPSEKIELSVLLDATDQLERGTSLPQALGIYPSLYALEMLLYPTAARVVLNATLARAGWIEIIPPLPAFTFLVWGPLRVMPVQLESLTVAEEQFDSGLTPIRANVSMSLKVLTYDDVGLDSVSGVASLVNHVSKEVLSKGASVAAWKSLGDNRGK